MKQIVFIIMCLVLVSCEAANAQCFLFSRHNQVVRDVNPSQPYVEEMKESGFRRPETLSEANAYFRTFCPEEGKALLEELVSLEGTQDELADSWNKRGKQEMIIRLGVAAEVAKRHGEILLSRRFSIEAELLRLMPKQHEHEVGIADDVTKIWFRNLEAQILPILMDEEPYKTLLSKLSPAYADEISGRGWTDAVSFRNYRLLVQEYTGEEIDDPILSWAAFRMIPKSEFYGSRKGMPPSAVFSTADRFSLEEFIANYSK